MSGSHKISSNTVSSEFYELVSDVKDEIVNSDDKHEIAFGGPLDEPEQLKLDSNSEKLEIDKFNQDTLHLEIPSIDDEIDIKYEEQNSALNGENDLDLDPDDELSKMNPKPGQLAANQGSEQIELSRLYLDLLQCERDCETCQKYIRELMEHVRCTHATAQPTSDPLHIDPPEIGPSSSIEIKCEEDKGIENLCCSEEIESDPDFDGECDSDSDSDPDYSTSPHFAQNGHCRNVAKETSSVETELKIPNEGTSTLLADIQAQVGDKQCPSNLTRSHLIPHTLMRSHTGEKPFNCTVCGKGFSRKSGLEVHMFWHTGVKPFKCEQCAKNFTTNVHLTSHLRTHTGAKPFKCDECEESFSQSCNLQRHRRSHTGEKPFNCTVCGKCFSRKSGLEVHMICHTDAKPFKCKRCAKSFARQHHLTRHIESNRSTVRHVVRVLVEKVS